MTVADPVASRLLDRTGVCGAPRGTLSQRQKVTGRAFDRQIGSTKRGDRYADCRISTGFAFDRPICHATADRKWSSGESRLGVVFSILASLVSHARDREARDGQHLGHPYDALQTDTKFDLPDKFQRHRGGTLRAQRNRA